MTQTPRAGWAVATGGGETVAIDTTVSPELQREGLAREFVRLVADARKNDGLEVTDRIWLRWSADDPEVAAALTEHAGLIAVRCSRSTSGRSGRRARRARRARRPRRRGSTSRTARPDVLARAGLIGAAAGWSGRQARHGLQPAWRAAPSVIFSRSPSPMNRMSRHFGVW